MTKENYDLIIIGGGPAGLMAAVYAARYKLKTLVVSKTMGGTAATAHKICNHPSHVEIKGFELMQKYTKQVEELKVPIIYDEVTNLEIGKNNEFKVSVSEDEFKAKKVIFAIGTERTKLNIPGENKLLGRGVSYCATCDAALFKNKTVAVVGGSNAALTAALLLAEYCHKVYLIYRGEKFIRPEPAWVELVENEKKIEILFKEEVVEIKGEKSVEEIKLKSGKMLKLNGVFVETGSIAKTDLISNLNVKLDERGYVTTDKEGKTDIHGLFAAGDITNNTLKQIVTAAAEGAIAAHSAYKEIKQEEIEY
jgi:thioredoxin reductase (NADPH)